jgi:hypothetical protein
MPDEYKFHPLADIFPMMSEQEHAALVEDIRAHGLKHPITKQPAPDNKIIDGRNRYRACLEAGVLPRFVDFPGGNVLVFIATENLHRRQLNVSQRSMVIAKIRKAASGEDWRSIAPRNSPSVENTGNAAPANLRDQQSEHGHSSAATMALAEAYRVSPRSVESADAVIAKGVPELQRAVEEGKIAVSAAAKIAQLPAAEQLDRVEASQPKEPKKERVRIVNEGKIVMQIVRFAFRNGIGLVALIVKLFDQVDVKNAELVIPVCDAADRLRARHERGDAQEKVEAVVFAEADSGVGLGLGRGRSRDNRFRRASA